MLRSIIGFPSSLFLATNNQRYVAYMTFSRALALTLVIVPFIYFFGLIGAAYAAISSVIVEFPIGYVLNIQIFIKRMRQVNSKITIKILPSYLFRIGIV